ncbi:hypothetical protein TESS_TESS_01429 [Tessaracoccus sp. O5.2]
MNVMLMDKSFSELTTTELYAILQLRHMPATSVAP